LAKVNYRSPEVKSFEVEGRVAVVTFEMFGSSRGLVAPGKDIRNLRIAGSDKQFHPAKAELSMSGDKLYVFSALVEKPVAVRYCFDNISATELFTVEGNLPVSSFRTDDW
jgi:sialate O-acetylesterase